MYHVICLPRREAVQYIVRKRTNLAPIMIVNYLKISFKLLKDIVQSKPHSNSNFPFPKAVATYPDNPKTPSINKSGIPIGHTKPRTSVHQRKPGSRSAILLLTSHREINASKTLGLDSCAKALIFGSSLSYRTAFLRCPKSFHQFHLRVCLCF